MKEVNTMQSLLIILLSLLHVTTAADVCAATWGTMDDLNWADCGFASDMDVFLARSDEQVERDCACYKGAVLLGATPGDIACLGKVYDCTTIHCARRSLLSEVELFGPSLSNPGTSCVDMRRTLQLRTKNDCYGPICANIATAKCPNDDILQTCDNVTLLYSYWATQDLRTSPGYIMQYKNDNGAKLSVTEMTSLKNTLSALLNVKQDEIMVLFPSSSGGLNMMQIVVPKPTAIDNSKRWATESDNELAARMQSDQTLLDTIRPAAPAWCSPYLSVTTLNGFGVPGKSVACAAAIPPSAKFCDTVACGCLNYSNTMSDSTCSFRYGQQGAYLPRVCFLEQIACYNRSEWMYLRGSDACRSAYETISGDSLYKACMKAHCVNDASRLYPQASLEDVCNAVKAYGATLPKFGEAMDVYVPVTVAPTATPSQGPAVVTPAPTPTTATSRQLMPNLALAWTADPTTGDVDFVITGLKAVGTTEQWYAIGFNSDPRMSGTDAMLCSPGKVTAVTLTGYNAPVPGSGRLWQMSVEDNGAMRTWRVRRPAIQYPVLSNVYMGVYTIYAGGPWNVTDGTPGKHSASGMLEIAFPSAQLFPSLGISWSIPDPATGVVNFVITGVKTLSGFDQWYVVGFNSKNAMDGTDAILCGLGGSPVCTRTLITTGNFPSSWLRVESFNTSVGFWKRACVAREPYGAVARGG